MYIFQGVSSEKTFYIQTATVPGDLDAKRLEKPSTNFT